MKANIPDDIHVTQPQGVRQMLKVAMITTDGTEDQEFFYPYYRFNEEGYQVDVLTPKGGEFKGKNGAGLKNTMKIEEADPKNYALLYIPGGKAPEKLKKEKAAVEWVRNFAQSGKPIGAICHGPQLLAEAGVISGVGIAAWPECQEEVEKAGGKFRNEACVVDKQFITGRWPGDLPAQVHAVLQHLESGTGGHKMAA